MEEQRYYVCGYCHKEYEPKRRRVQQYCSNTCRSKAYQARTTVSNKLTTAPENKQLELSKFGEKQQVEAMSVAGIGNAAVGALTADRIKAIFTHNDNKPATKGDLKKLASEINGRYHLVKNIPKRIDGALPYFDLDTNEIVYFYMK